MSSYFPIPPNFPFDSSNNKFIKSSITLINYPTNFLKKNFSNINKNDLYFSIYTIENNIWRKVNVYKCSFGETIELSRDKISLDDERLLIAVPSIDKNNLEECTELPKPYSNRLDKSGIAERASLNFKIDNSCASYQGEYPYKMTTLEKGTFSTFDNLRLDIDNLSKTFLLTMNINRYPTKRGPNLVEIYDPETNETTQNFIIESNSFKSNVLEKTNFSYSSQSLRVISCHTSVFIPLFLSCKIHDNLVNITVEHTHPPGSFFWGEKLEARKIIKQNWVKR